MERPEVEKLMELSKKVTPGPWTMDWYARTVIPELCEYILQLESALQPFAAEYTKFRWVEYECEERHDDIAIASCKSTLQIRQQFKAAHLALTSGVLQTPTSGVRSCAFGNDGESALQTKEGEA